MKANTISIIRDILKDKMMVAESNYINFEHSLLSKYGVKYNFLATPDEKKMYRDVSNEFEQWIDVFNDFSNHNWD